MERPARKAQACAPLGADVVEALVANHRNFLAFLERRTGNREIAEELLQTAFVRTAESRAELRDGEGAIAWFYRLLRNALVDYYRKRAAEDRALDRHARDLPPDRVEPELRSTICSCVHDLLPTLKPEYAEVVRKVDLEEIPLGAVAEEIGVSRNNAAVRLHRGRQALRRRLEESCATCAAHGCLDCSCKGEVVELTYRNG